MILNSGGLTKTKQWKSIYLKSLVIFTKKKQLKTKIKLGK